MATLENGDTFATGLVRPKTTALFFDKLWVPWKRGERTDRPWSRYWDSPEVDEICIDDPLGTSLYRLGYVSNNAVVKDWSRLGRFEDVDQASLAQLRSQDADSIVDYADGMLRRSTRSTYFRNKALTEIASRYAQRGVALTPVYLDPIGYDVALSATEAGIEACLASVPVPFEENLTWRQVAEIRMDLDARNKLLRFRRWFSTELRGKSVDEITSTLEMRLEQYRWALKKHGVETAVGGLTSTVATVAAPKVLEALSGAQAAQLASGIILASGAVAWLVKKAIERAEIRRDPVAFIHDVRALGPN